MKKNIILVITLIVLGFISISILVDFVQEKKLERLYDAGEYESALQQAGLLEESAQNLHNIGNIFYEQFNQQEEIDSLELLQQSVDSYSGSLAIEDNELTQYNYDYTKSLLDMLERQEQEPEQEQNPEPQNQKQQDEGDENNNGEPEESDEGQESSEPGENSDGQESQNNGNGTIQNSRPDEYQLGENEQIEQMTESEREAVEQSIEELKRDQAQNQRFYNKEVQESDFQKAFDSFFNRGGEKDW
ncbi:hypothetical protein GW846_03560 [Candidatus Gracilibacteria bacterium]|nr:hypothetical protein [Candidatus Gracilibacteria bacterium]